MTGAFAESAPRYAVYPMSGRPLRVAVGGTVELAITQVAGPTIGGLPYEQMMFVYVAVQGSATISLTIVGGSGDPVSLDAKAAPVHRNPGDIGYIGDAWIDSVDQHGVYRIHVGFTAATTELWRLRVRNDDPHAETGCTLVVAGDPDSARQPWVNVEPKALTYDVLAGQQRTESVVVTNSGTVECAITGVTPQLPAAFVITTPMPVVIAAAGSLSLAIRFDGPAVPPAPAGVLTAAARVRTEPPDTTTTGNPGHSIDLALHATTRWPRPSLGPQGRQFTPHIGPPGTPVTLRGSGFDAGGLVVQFGGKLAPQLAPPTSTGVRVSVPTLTQGSDVTVEVITTGGGVLSTDVFRVRPDFARAVQILDGAGAPVANVPVLRAPLPGDPAVTGSTNAQGRWGFQETAFDPVKLMIGAPGWTAVAAACEVDDWIGERTFTVSAVPNGGGLIVNRTGSIPGLTGRLNPIRDALDRLYLYADNISVDSSSYQPVTFAVGAPFTLQDALGVSFRTEVRASAGNIFLLAYSKAGQEPSTIHRSARVIDSNGAPVAGLAVMRVAANGTFLGGQTDSQGRWVFDDWFTGEVKLLAGGPGWTAAAATFGAGQWIGEKTLTVSAAAGGSLIIASTGFVPGLNGRLNPIRDWLDRLYLYADNCTIDGSADQPVGYRVGIPFRVVDAAGHRFRITILEILGRSSLLQYVKE
ncbi:IPT/TIG domain-containing protein [Nocardia bovistercoris]|uniref:IPT/TIG domain-containing protein n=1 Tax=Nocardia bovistercoris TaxID=2785916 RepID=A0A931I809_9NOCA|nr:IPT/TIG domain-containing protein [Nocardia bovistercoris]MBH0775560.1 IPT/TIG domain-containing protein [Nocardia bovistercoris]